MLGALWNGKDKPPFDNDDGKNDKRIFKSRKKHYLLFDDGSQGRRSSSRTRRAGKVLFDDDGIVVEDEKGNTVKIDSNGGAITIEAKRHAQDQGARRSPSRRPARSR